MTTDDASAALSEMHYTLIAVGTRGEEAPRFMIANWATQTSFDPWRFVVAIKKSAQTLANLQANQAFTVNLLRRGDEGLVQTLMKTKGEDEATEEGGVNAPRLAAAYAGLDCRLVQTIEVGGDHVLVVGEVADGWKRREGPALTLPQLNLSYAG